MFVWTGKSFLNKRFLIPVNASVKFFPNLFPKSFLKRVAYYICLFTISLSITFKVLDKLQETARILDGLAGCLTELCASDFY